MSCAALVAEEEGRSCSVCSTGMDRGWYCCDEYYCSSKCLNASFVGSGTTWEQHYSEAGDCYWTEWEKVAV